MQTIRFKYAKPNYIISIKQGCGTMKKTIAIILIFCFMISNGILTYAKNTDGNSNEICVWQIIEKYGIDDIKTLYMARNVKDYTEQITIKEKEEISDFLKELYNLKLTTNKNEGNIKIDLWRDSALGTVTIYSSTKGLSNQDISYYIDLQDVDRIIEKMNLHWVENNAGGPGYPVAVVAPKENSETLIVNNVFAQEFITDIKARIKHQKETLKYEMTDTIAVKPVDPYDCEKILKEALNEYEYVITKYHDAIKTYTVKFNSADDADKAVDILNERDDIVYAQNDYYVGGQGTPVRPSVPVLPPNKEELSKTYEINILNENGIIVGDPDRDLREGDEITRAEFAAVLCRAMGYENETENNDLKHKNYFPDVPAEHWAAGYVNFAYENGAISGFPDGNFYPEEKVTNEQVIKMLIGA